MQKKKLNYHERTAEFYNSIEWKNLRNRKFYDANGICENCYKEVDSLGNHKIKQGREVHHIIFIEDNWNKRFDYDNLILLCSDCHNAEHERISPLQKFLKDWESM